MPSRTPLPSADLTIIRQLLELQTEFIEAFSIATPYSHLLPNQWQHKLKVMRELTASLSAPSADTDTPYNYHCLACGAQFEEPHTSFGPDTAVDVCPQCGNGRIRRNRKSKSTS